MFLSRPAHRVRAYRPRFEVLESRHLLSTYVVDRLTDTGAGAGLAGDLRYCITQAGDGDDVSFSVTGTIDLTGPLPDLRQSISIDGPGPDLLTVSNGGFTVAYRTTVSISGLTIANGSGIGNDGTLTVSNCTVTDNGGYEGGGISNDGTLTLSNSTVSGNVALAGGGIGNFDDGSMTISNSTISGNGASGDLGSGVGAGIYNGGTMLITSSTISDNSVFGRGGGIANGTAYHSRATLTISNSTISGNAASGGGAGIAVGWTQASFGTVTINNSTISSNTSLNGYSYGDGIDISAGTLNLRNTIVAGNSSYDLAGRLSSSGYNLIGNPVGGSGFTDTDLLVVDPLLGPLQDNGGPTQTTALLSGSPALNAGDPTELGVADQRGVLRTGGVSIGAYQASATAFVLSAPDTADPGAPFDLTVAAVDPFGQPAYGYTGTVTFATTDPDPGVVLPADYTFTPADQGAHTFSGGVTLMTPGDQGVSAADTTDNTIGGSATVTVTGGAAAPGRHRGADGVDEFFAALAADCGRRGS